MTRDQRLGLARAVLEGLATGDAFGEMCAYRYENVRERVALGLPAGPWWWTDDTAMALGIEECVARSGRIEEEMLVWIFSRNYKREPDRGYGDSTARLLRQIGDGQPWEALSKGAFGGGSKGNGAAMRVGPLGAWFADEPERLPAEAIKSARVTHWHAEGIAGAIAVAVAVSLAWRTRELPASEAREAIGSEVLRLTPEGETREGIAAALKVEPRLSPAVAGRRLGNGAAITAPDTVPYVIWSALRSLDDYPEALIATVEGGGDCDTNAAMVGGILTARLGLEAIPKEWREAREALPVLAG